MRVAVTCRLHSVNQYDFVEGLARACDFELYVITDSYSYEAVPHLDQSHVYHYRPAWTTRYFPTRFNPIDRREFRTILDDVDPDVVLTLGSSYLLFMSVAADFSPSVFLPQGGETMKATGNPYWTSRWWDLLYYRLLYRPLFGELVGHVDEVWSAEPNYETFARFGLEPDEYRPLDWGAVDTDAFHRVDDPVSFGDEGDTVVGSFRRPRGTHLLPSYETFLDAVGELVRRRDDVHVVLGGFYDDNKDAPVRSLVEEKVAEHGLEEHLTRLDMVPKSEMRRHYSGLDVYVNLSHMGSGVSGLGTASKEAMACECAFVTFDDPPKDYVIDDGENGFLVSHGEPATVADRLETLCEDPEFRDDLGAAARETVVAEYSPETIAERVERACREVVSD